MKEHISVLKRMKEKISDVKDKNLQEELNKILEELHGAVSDVYDTAIHDKKTGLYNNYFFETVLEMETHKASRGEQKLSVYMADIDFFKRLNDSYGHIEADKLLLRLANLIKKQIRMSDVAARFGGEEFIILFPKTGLDKAIEFAYRLRTLVKNDPIFKRHSLTISAGLTEYKPLDTPEKIMRRVDSALYKSKEQGRDRFIVIK
ncbi:MAG TPA: GGDEF domain-containing protein [Candidatus Nanoarchaeia archaeon]|nr:GGDEF domain-containing protein [Candidatus Nanoarchaeia archaeon]